MANKLYIVVRQELYIYEYFEKIILYYIILYFVIDKF